MWWGISASLCEVFYMEAAMISASRQQCSVCLCLKHLCDAFISIWTKRKKEATLLNFTVWFTSKFCSLTIQSVCSKVLYHSQFQQSLLDHQDEYGDVICHKNDQWEICTTGIWGFCPLRKKIGQFVAEIGQPLHKRKDVVVNQLYVHIRAFETKLQLFQHCVRC